MTDRYYNDGYDSTTAAPPLAMARAMVNPWNYQDATPATCGVCLDAPPNVRLAPCFHQVLCVDCLEGVMRTTCLCPVCRDRITNAASAVEDAAITAKLDALFPARRGQHGYLPVTEPEPALPPTHVRAMPAYRIRAIGERVWTAMVEPTLTADRVQRLVEASRDADLPTDLHTEDPGAAVEVGAGVQAHRFQGSHAYVLGVEVANFHTTFAAAQRFDRIRVPIPHEIQQRIRSIEANTDRDLCPTDGRILSEVRRDPVTGDDTLAVHLTVQPPARGGMNRGARLVIACFGIEHHAANRTLTFRWLALRVE